MTSITTRQTAGGGATVKGTPLTNTEMDTNLINLNVGQTTNVDITGGTIDGVPIGDTTPSTGSFTSLMDSGLTAGRITFASTGGLLADSAGLTFDGTTLTSTKFSGAFNGTLGATTPSTVAATTITGTDLTTTGNTTLGDASTDTVTVNGYMGVGGAGASPIGLYVKNSALTGTTQHGILVEPSTTTATSNFNAIYTYPTIASSASTFAAVRGVFVSNPPALSGGATITDLHGIQIADQTRGTNNYGITSLVSSGTNKFNIYASGTAQNYFAGNVGIGTSSPNSRLHVSNSTDASSVDIILANTFYAAASTDELVSFQGEFYQNDVSANRAAGWMRFGKTGDFSNNANASAFLAFATRNAGTIAEKMRITSSGNLLLGVSTARSTFFNGGTYSIISQIEGTDYATSSASIIRNSAGAGEPGLVFAKSRGATTGSYTIVQSDDGLGDISFQGANGVATFIEAARISASVDATPGSADMPGRLMFYTTADGATTVTERMRIDSSGNVGIGATSGAYRLEVTNLSSDIAMSTASNNVAYNLTGTATNYPDGTKLVISATNNALDNSATLITFSNRSTAGYTTAFIGAIAGTVSNGGSSIVFGRRNGSGTTNAESMRIDSSGNLLVGTTDPAPRNLTTTTGIALRSNGVLEVAATGSNFINLTSASGTLLTFRRQANDVSSITTDGTNISYNAQSALIFGTNGTTERMRIDSSGNVGINTASLAAIPNIFTVYGAQPASIASLARFGLNGNGGAGRGVGIILAAGGSSNSVDVAQIAGLQETASATANNASLTFQVANTSGTLTERMRIDSSGNVGIGNSNPTEKLEVVNSSGSVTARIWSATNTTPIASLELQRGTNATWGADAYGDYRIRNDDGALLFQYGDSGTTSERMRIDSSGNVGIGTVSPATLLDVNGISRVGYFSTQSKTLAITSANVGAGNFGVLSLPVSGTYGGKIRITAQRPVADATGNQKIIAEFTVSKSGGSTGANSYFYVTSAQVDTSSIVTYQWYFDSTTGVPALKFYQSANSWDYYIETWLYTTASISVAMTTTTPTGVAVYPTYTIQNLSAPSSGLNILTTNNTTGLAMDSAGNVGIGTSSPTSFGGSYKTLDVVGGSAANGGYIRTATSNGSVAGGMFTATSAFYVGSITNTNMVFRTNDTNRMTLDSSGNLGIGTTPSTPLHAAVDNATNNDVTTMLTLTHTTSGTAADGIGTAISFQSEAAAGTTQTTGGIHSILSNATNISSALYFTTRNNGGSLTERMRIDSAGNVIIGSGEASATPVGNTVRAPSATGTNIVGANLTITSGNGTGTGGSGYIAFQTALAGTTGATANTMTDRMRIDSAGNVGIGATSLTDKFTVAAANSQVRLIDTDDSTYSQFSYSSNALAIRINSTTADHFWLNSSGNLGIGTASPSYKLTTSDGTSSLGLDPTVGQLITNYSGGLLLNSSAASSYILFRVAGTERMRISSSGGVYIGTAGTDPGANNLQVSGSIGIGVSPTAYLNIKAGTATASTAPIKLTSGTNLTTAEAGAVEYDGAVEYFTANTTNGRGLTPTTNIFRLTANGAATATTISPFFGTNSSIPLVANGIYEIEIECYFTKTTAGTLTWTLTNSAVVTNMNASFEMSPITGVATAGAAPLMGYLVAQTAAAAAFGATGSLTTGVNHWIKFNILLENASSTSIRLNVTNSAGTITPLRGSYWKATRLPATNNSTYAA